MNTGTESGRIKTVNEHVECIGYHVPQFSEADAYAQLMVIEWIECIESSYERKADDELAVGQKWKNSGARNNRAWELIDVDYPYLADIKDNEGVYGLRRIAIHIGATIERAFQLLPDDFTEEFIHGTELPDGKVWSGVGCYDFELVPLCCEHVMELEKNRIALGGEKEIKITIKQIYQFMWEQIPESIRPEHHYERT